MTDRETVAHALWKAEATNAGAPDSLAKSRTLEAFADQSEQTRSKWLKLADAAFSALDRPEAQDGVADEARFLIARIDEWQADGLNDDNARDWTGHVQPSLERLRRLTKAED